MFLGLSLAAWFVVLVALLVFVLQICTKLPSDFVFLGGMGLLLPWWWSLPWVTSPSCKPHSSLPLPCSPAASVPSTKPVKASTGVC